MKALLLIPTLLILSTGASAQSDLLHAAPHKDMPNTTERWYSAQDIQKGQQVFKQNCAACHGDKAQGIVKDWRAELPNGKYPAPPLNGSAHAWHHRLKALDGTIQRGGIPIGGTMPAFKDKLTRHERLQAIAYFQSFWSDNIYQAWLKRGGLKP
ncbi:Cytochrome c, class IC:Cytochrome c, class I [hydrothermal vent metagenome]|uniref:Cytochrome c, class IC:Cytochrome c, class I n=1 Tax=hydrothermal vent metagenome TaxID=652676 RepID=A0A3B0W9P3_9ZZZZ